MVSHDAQTSYALADRIVLLSQGKIIKDAPPSELFTATTKVVYHL
jgi:ABC-type sulfate/molybdate transport systems ATPase subunit